MAWTVHRKDLSPEQIAIIDQNLWLTPKSFYEGGGDSFQAFQADDNDVSLPFYFGRVLAPQRRVPRPFATPGRMWSFGGTAGYTLRDTQVEIMLEVINQLQTFGTSSINASCAAGKTIMAIYAAVWANRIMAGLNLFGPVIITYPLKLLDDQWDSTVRDFSDCYYYVVNSKKAAETAPLADIYLCMLESLPFLPEPIRKGCSLLILDEAHLFCTEHRLRLLMSIEPSSVLLLTATPIRANGMHTILELLAGTHAVKRIHMKPFTVWRFNTGLNPPLDKKNSQGKVDWTAVVDWLSENPDRNNMLLEFIRVNPDRKIMIILSRVKHAEYIFKCLQETGESVGILGGKHKTCSNCRVLVAIDKKGGTGFDEKAVYSDFDGTRIDLVMIVISTKQPEQYSGRGFRALREPHIIHFVDTGKIFNDHWKLCHNFYVQPQRVELVTVKHTNQPCGVSLPQIH